MKQTLALPTPFTKWAILFWIAQLILASLFGLAGVMKTFMAPEALAASGINYATELPYWLLRFIGICELSGAIGIVLPTLTRILPRLAPLAALGFVMIQVLAIGFHAVRGELAMALPLNIVLLSLSLFVLWGRSKKLPVLPRG
ncbi:DoxX family protein [Rhizobium sp. ICMP 5592]|nr:DoxX family protein [Rhizobium sp. ICMP 5592]